MKAAFAFVLLIIITVLQVTAGQALGLYWPNVVIVMIVVLATLLPLDSLLLPTVLAGLIADYYSGADFGLHIAYYLLTLLVSKLVVKLGEKDPSVVVTTLLAVGFNVLYSFIRIIGTKQFLSVAQWPQIGWVLVGRSVVTAVLTVALLWAVRKLYLLVGRWSRFYAQQV